MGVAVMLGPRLGLRPMTTGLGLGHVLGLQAALSYVHIGHACQTRCWRHSCIWSAIVMCDSMWNKHLHPLNIHSFIHSVAHAYKIIKTIPTRRMYWRRASIQDGQAFTSAWWRHCSRKRFFRDNFVIFSSQIKENSIFGISEFFYMCLYANFQFSWWSRDHFSAPFSYICQMPDHRLSRLAKAHLQSGTLNPSIPYHTFRVSAFHWYQCFRVKLFSVGCAQDIRRQL